MECWASAQLGLVERVRARAAEGRAVEAAEVEAAAAEVEEAVEAAVVMMERTAAAWERDRQTALLLAVAGSLLGGVALSLLTWMIAAS